VPTDIGGYAERPFAGWQPAIQPTASWRCGAGHLVSISRFNMLPNFSIEISGFMAKIRLRFSIPVR
jgi:hypothetical protein